MPTVDPQLPEGAITLESLETGAVEAVASDPEAAAVPSVNGDIQALLRSVSTQNLFAYVQTLQGFGTRHTLSTGEAEDYGVGAAARWIYGEFVRVGGGRLDVTFDEFPLIYEGLQTTQRNVVATLPGSGSHPGVIILTAHYDSRSVDEADGSSPAPGADDNGSGVALLLEAARLLSARSWNQTIIFVAFAAEEQGTHGSRHFVKEVMLDGMVIDAVINNDTVGGGAAIPQSVRLFAVDPDTSMPRQLARYVEFIGELYLPEFPINVWPTLDRVGRYGDQREFIEVGVPAVRLTESVEDFDSQHSGEDTSEKLDYDYLALVTQLNVAVVANMAGAPSPPAGPAVAPMAEAGAYILSWETDPGAAGYAVAFRTVGADEAVFRYLSMADAGNVVITGLDPAVSYAISVAAVDSRGRMSLFSEEALTQSQ